MSAAEAAISIYAMVLDPGPSARVLGGPYRDIDDVLDACFDEVAGRGTPEGSVFYVEVTGIGARARELPSGALPVEAEL